MPVSAEHVELVSTISQSNLRLSVLLTGTRRALSGESAFTGLEIRELSSCLAGMAPLLKEKTTLLQRLPALAAPLAIYKTQLAELQTILDQLNVMLQAQRAAMFAGRLHVASVRRWSQAWQQTR